MKVEFTDEELTLIRVLCEMHAECQGSDSKAGTLSYRIAQTIKAAQKE